MNFDSKGLPQKNTKITNLINYIIGVKDNQLWEYMGLKVEIDPTVDYSDENILVRWTDIEEGFNDKILVNSLKEFNQNFKPIT
ncbi:hypothetical protein [Flavobacterium macrobrachii]|jgi:hypothetical protein|uniref:hypothetical protein n=1 Tax=Flavobacterium macrobrachii TaxID=591204 RepID=UPI0037C0F897